MKRNLGLGLVLSTVILSAAGFLLRRRQVAEAFEPDTGLLTPGKPVTAALVAVTAVGAALLLALVWRMFRGETKRGYLANLVAPNMAVGILAILAGALLFAGGALGIRDFALRMDERIVRLILGICLVPGGVCAGLVGLLGQQRTEAKGRFHGALLAPGYCACVWLVAAYQGHTANPNVMEYVFLLLGVSCAILACYAGASFSFEKPRPVLCGFFSAMGVVLLTVSLADRPWGMDLLVTLGFTAYLLAQLICLVSCRVKPPELEEWTPSPEETAPVEEQQVQPRGEEDE